MTFGHNVRHYEKQPAKNAVTLNWPFNVIQLYMTSYKCLIETLVIACTVSEILAQIDQNPTLKLPLEWFHIFHIVWQDWFHTKEPTWCNTIGQHFDRFWEIKLLSEMLDGRQTTDNSTLEKARKAPLPFGWQS